MYLSSYNTARDNWYQIVPRFFLLYSCKIKTGAGRPGNEAIQADPCIDSRMRRGCFNEAIKLIVKYHIPRPTHLMHHPNS